MTELARRIKSRRGIALVLALFTTAVLFSLFVAFGALARGEARTSRSASYASVCQSAANWGVEFLLNYMGRGGNWKASFDADSLDFFEVLDEALPNGDQHLADADGNSYRIEMVANPNGDDANARLVRIFGPGPEQAAISVGELDDPNRLLATVEVMVTPIRVPGFAGQPPQYVLNSTARLYRPEDDITNLDTAPLASRVVEVRVRQKPETSDLIHVQNMRSWDAQGVGIGHPQMADRIFIPSAYRTDGTVRITGTDPQTPGAPWEAQAGNLRFQNPESDDLAFEGPLFINKLGNLGPSGDDFVGPDLEAYQGPVSFGSEFLPLPDVSFYLNSDKNGNGVIDNAGSINNFSLADANEERGLLYAASVDSAGDPVEAGPLVRGYYGVDREAIVEGHARHPRLPDPAGGALPVTHQNYAPPIPEVEIVLMDDGMLQVNYWETNHGDGGINNTEGSLNDFAITNPENGPVGTPFHFSQLKHGTIYVEGGNAVVRSELSGGETAEFEGRLTIASAEETTRRPIPRQSTDDPMTYTNVAGSIYHQAARDYFNYVRGRAQLPSDDPNYIAPENFPAPPYTANTLVQAANAGLIDSDVAGLPNDDTLYWHPPSSENLVREGNIVIGGDIRKKENSSAILGLSAENFILLNDRTVNLKDTPTELTVDSVLMSFKHSVQLDWDNTGKNRVLEGELELHDRLTGAGFNGKFIYKGSLIGAFSDVEGDVTGKGYIDQDFEHDRDLLNFGPPFQPRALLSSYPNGQIAIEWQIKQYVDRGSLNTYLRN